ncbi:hypothetical protein BG011_000938 [Mortierella polycephala]|uniref:tRNA (guanine-N(7)-)-methyltransferase non-catalytic subunit TRM82 n=1 Tax=Mortierella polycephala TaxID=41804 RepID=A0A9P6U6E6_9FUNG|nr:hypothetical protein BG011_000938 [Mortierella polycephala]
MKKKVLLMGKSGSGKTSMRSIIFSNYIARDTRRLGATIDVEHSHVRFLGNLVLNLWDCGGQETFMENYFASQRDHIFKNVEVLIYVFDVESRDVEKDMHYYQSCLEAIMTNSKDAKIFCLIHKMDLVQEDQRDKIYNERVLELQTRSLPLQVVTFRTSIWDETLYKAWSSIVYSLIPNVQLLESHLDNFCKISEADEIVLFERMTFLVIAHSTRVDNGDVHRFEKISNIIKQFKLSCSRTQGSFQSMEVRHSNFAGFIDYLTGNTYVMVIMSDPTIQSAATLMNISSARKHFEKLEGAQFSKSGVIVSSTVDLEERDSNGLQMHPITNTPDAAQENKARVQVLAFSRDGAYLATAADDKVMKIWDTESWKCLGTRTLIRRSNALEFNKDGSHVVTADKFGDIYNMVRDIPDVVAPVKTAETSADAEGDEDEGEQPILGHVSMATDLALTKDNKYIITADRDEHIRVSQYPKGHNIETYCLGHTSFVTNIKMLPGEPQKYLISGAGDATVRVWEFLKGQEVQTFGIRDALGMPPAEPDAEEDVAVFSLAICEKKNHIAVIMEKESRLLILQWNEPAAKVELFKVLELEGKPTSADYDRSGNLWVTIVPEEGKNDLVAVYDNDYVQQEDLTKYINTFGSKTVETIPDLFNTEELRKHTTDWRELKKAREEKEAARLAGDPDAPLSKKRRKNKNSRKIPENAAEASSSPATPSEQAQE